MFVRWENVLDILTDYSVNNNFMETFKYTPNNEKITLCMQNEFIRYIFSNVLSKLPIHSTLCNICLQRLFRTMAG